MGIHYEQSNFYLVLGTKDKLVITPKGITVNDYLKRAWAPISIACEGEVQHFVEATDGRMRELLSDNSEALFGMKCTPEMITKYKFYTPLAYSKEDFVLAPLAGGKVVMNTIVEDEHGHQMNNTSTDSSLKQLSDTVSAGSKVRLVCSLRFYNSQAQIIC
ncbi:TPA: hypothetical protein ACH3X1_000175 [Trebouxia sp. C0004]